jgi:uncharacterized protein (UPF0305 family)
MKDIKKEEYITKFEIKQNVINGNPAIRTIDAYKCLDEYKNDYVDNFIDFLSQRYKGIKKDNLLHEKIYFESLYEKSSELLNKLSKEI